MVEILTMGINGNDGSGGQGKGPSINYVVSKLAIIFLLSKVYVSSKSYLRLSPSPVLPRHSLWKAPKW